MSLRPLPSRFTPPLVGDTPAFLRDPAGLLAERRRALGPVFRIRVLGEDVACFCGPRAFAHFLDERTFTRASASPPHIRAIMGEDAVPFLDGDAFKKRKELLMQAFAPAALDAYTPVIERVMTRFLGRALEKRSFAWVPDLTSMGMTIAGALFLGADPDREDPALEEGFQTAFDGFLTVPVSLPFTPYGRALQARDALRARIDAAIAEHVDGAHDDAMSRLLRARTASGAGLTRDEVRIETFHFFGAYVPLIGAIAYLAALLGQHRDVKEKLRAEVKEKLASGAVTMSALRELPYLDRVCRESRRAQPILPITFFARVKERHDFDGVEVPAGIKAIGSIAGTLHDADSFPEPARFDPDRWLDANAGERLQHAWVPHGGGAHLLGHRCAGEQLANLMMKTFAVLALRDVDWELDGGQDLTPAKGRLFATPKDGLRVRLTRVA